MTNIEAPNVWGDQEQPGVYIPPVETTYNQVIDEVHHQDVIQPIDVPEEVIVEDTLSNQEVIGSQPVNEITQEEVIMEETLPIQEEIAVATEFVQPTSIAIKVNFPKSATPVDCVSATTNCSDKIVAANKQLALLQNRFYFVPVDCDESIDSDKYSVIKVYSEYAAAIDVKYVKNGFACIMPLKHNFKIRQDMVIAMLF